MPSTTCMASVMLRQFIVTSLILACGSTVARAEPVQVKQAPGYDFSELHSYAFAWEIYPETYKNHPVAQGAPVDPSVERAVDKVLAAKGFERISSGDPDFLVNCTGFVQEEMLIEGSHIGVAEGLAWTGEGPSPGSYEQGLPPIKAPGDQSARSTEVALHRIEIIDFRSGDVIWSGWDVQVARDALSRRKKLEKWTRRIIRRFPPE